MSKDFTDIEKVYIHKLIKTIKRDDYFVCGKDVIFYKNINDMELSYPNVVIHTNTKIFTIGISAIEYCLNPFPKIEPLDPALIEPNTWKFS